MTRIDPRFAPESAPVRHVARVVGRRQLRRLREQGLPESLVEPLRFLVEREMRDGDYGPVDRIEALRATLAATEGTVAAFAVPTRGGGSERHDEATPVERPMADVAHISSVPPLWGVFLHVCARSAGARTILELGAAAGISGAYLASAPTCQRFVTVEGNADRAALARAHITSLNPHAEVAAASFDAALDALLPTFQPGLDFVFVDGNKHPGGYIALFDRFHTRLARGALVVFDDIQWTDMGGDWRHLCQREGLSWAINTGRFGVCVWEGGPVRPRVHALFGVGRHDLYAVRRDLLERFAR